MRPAMARVGKSVEIRSYNSFPYSYLLLIEESRL